MTHTDTVVGSSGARAQEHTQKKKLTAGETGKTYEDKEASDKRSQRRSVGLRGQCGDGQLEQTG